MYVQCNNDWRFLSGLTHHTCPRWTVCFPVRCWCLPQNIKYPLHQFTWPHNLNAFSLECISSSLYHDSAYFATSSVSHGQYISWHKDHYLSASYICRAIFHLLMVFPQSMWSARFSASWPHNSTKVLVRKVQSGNWHNHDSEQPVNHHLVAKYMVHMFLLLEWFSLTIRHKEKKCHYLHAPPIYRPFKLADTFIIALNLIF